MTVAPERESLEELDFPTPLMPAHQDWDGLLGAIATASHGEVVMTRLGPLSQMSMDELRDWICYCSPSRSMLFAQARAAEMERAARRARWVVAGFFALWAALTLLTLLV